MNNSGPMPRQMDPAVSRKMRGFDNNNNNNNNRRLLVVVLPGMYFNEISVTIV